VTLFRLALRSHRTGAIATAAIGGFAGLLNTFAYAQVAGVTHAERVTFAHSMELLGAQLTYLLPRPLQLDTMGGYVTWRDVSTVGLVYAVWAMLAGTGAGRGDEEKGLTEEWLATGISRARWLATRTAAFMVVTIASVSVTLALTALGAALANDPLPLDAVASLLLPMVALALWGFGLGLFIAQLVTTRRVAWVTATIVLVALFTVNSSVRAGGSPTLLTWLSPFYLSDRSTPLLAGGTVDVAASLGILLIFAVLVGLSLWAFTRRDIDGPLVRGRVRTGRPERQAARDPLLRLPVLATLDQQRGWILGWSIGLAVLAYFMTSLAHSVAESFNDVPAMAIYFARAGINGASSVVGVIWFSLALLFVVIFAVAEVNGWAADDAEGRLEVALAAGASRRRIVLERISTLLIAAAIVAAVSTVVVYLAAKTFSIAVPLDRLAIATALMLPVVFAFGAVGHALVGWRPRVAVVLMATIAVLSYFVEQFAPAFDTPEWVARTSFFTLYGTPMTSVDWGGAATLIGIGAIGTVVALMSMQGRDVGR
jgi:ABC-2 type transport system permease protein